MKYKIKPLYLFFLLLLLIISCNNKDKPFNDAILKVEKSLSQKELQKFSKTEEGKAIIYSHLGLSMKFRNEILNNKKDTTLLNYFHSKGIFHLDDMSSILFKSLHRKLNNKKINLEQQFAEKIEYWKPYKECERINKINLKKNDKYVKGDSVQIRMRINKIDNCAYPIECLNMQTDWKYNDYEDLLIKGIVLNKYSYDFIPKNKFMKIKVIEINKKSVAISRKIINEGDDFEVILNHNIIENWK